MATPCAYAWPNLGRLCSGTGLYGIACAGGPRAAATIIGPGYTPTTNRRHGLDRWRLGVA